MASDVKLIDTVSQHTSINLHVTIHLIYAVNPALTAAKEKKKCGQWLPERCD